jgi:membrane protease YdiL (CAAX protease family)
VDDLEFVPIDPPAQEPDPSPDVAELSLKRQAPYVGIFAFILLLSSLLLPADKTVDKRVKGEPLRVVTQEELKQRIKKRDDAYKQEHGEDAYNRRGMLVVAAMFAAGLASFTLLILLIVSHFTGMTVIPRGSMVTPHWGLIACLKCLLVFLFFGIVTGIFFSLFNTGGGKASHFTQGFIADSISKLAAVVVFIGILHWEYRSRSGELGLGRGALLRGVAGGAAGYVAFMAPLFAVTYGWVFLSELIGIAQELNPILGPLLDDPSPVLILVMVLAACVVAPIAEEFFFRGLLYSALREKLGWPLAAVLSGTVFGIVHAGFFNVPPIILLGVILAFLYERTRSLYAPMIAHAIHNAIAMGIFFFSIQGA